MNRNQSHFKTSTGDEAGSAPKKGVVTAKIKGKVYFTSWSMDVKVEGKNACRHMDTTTHNHGLQAGNTAPWPYADRVAMAKDAGKDCEEEKKKVDEKCKKDDKGKVKRPAAHKGAPKFRKDWTADDWGAYAKKVENDPCQKAAKCMLTPWKPSRCCKPQTPHHVIPKSSFYVDKATAGGTKIAAAGDYDAAQAPCICLEGTSYYLGSHGKAHTAHKKLGVAQGWQKGDYKSFGEHADLCTKAITNKKDGVAKNCSEECMKKQLKQQHEDMGVDNNGQFKHSPSTKSEANAAQKAAEAKKKAEVILR